MKDQGNERARNLRSRAEQGLRPEQTEANELSAEDARAIIHELRVHQIELELQNEELRNAQVQIEESRARYSDLYDFAPIGYVTLDDKGLIRQANLTAAKQLGIERSHLLQQPFHIHIAAEDREGFYLYLRNVLKARERQTCELRMLNHARVGFHVQIDGVSVRDSSGATLCNLAVTDVSERKRIEEELLKARKLEATGILAGGIAHDFNNLLAVILGNISLVEIELENLARIEPESGARGLAALANAAKAVFLAADLTKKFITFSSGGEACMVSTPVQQLVRDSSARALSGSNIACECSFGEGLEEVDGDRSQLRQALHEVILNAREAMPGGGTIRILAENAKPGPIIDESGVPLNIQGNFVRISIRDEGVGIPVETLPNIFDPYFSTKDRGAQKGMGLGLATVYSIIKKHNGHIHVESTVGIGTTFDIYLPVSRKKAALKRAMEKRPGEKNGKVLLMDDEELLRSMVGQMLNRLGYEVELAKEGAEAVKRFCRARNSGAPFDAVILDLTIDGGMGGRETLERLRAIDPSVKAIVSSGHSSASGADDFMGLGFDGVLQKPYEMRDLAEALQQVMAD